MNPASEVMLAMVRDGDPSRALAVLDAPTARSVAFGEQVRQISVEQVSEVLRDNGFDSVRRFGIRCVSDYLTDDERKSDPEVYAALEALELTLHDREPFVGLARMWQVVATRR